MNEEISYIKLFRKFEKWEWYTDINTKIVFLHCLIKANWKDGKFRGVDIKRGSFLTSNEKLARECGLTIQNIKTAISHLQSTNELTKSKLLNGTLITVLNYDLYQQTNQQVTNELNSDQPATNQRLTTIEEREEYKEGKDIKNIGVSKSKRFVKPSLEELTNYICENKFKVNAQIFMDYYISNGWKVGKNPMKDWKATVRQWNVRENKNNAGRKVDVLPKNYTGKIDWSDIDDI